MKALFFGGSHICFNNMPRLFASMCGKAAGMETEGDAPDSFHAVGGRSP